MKLYYSPGACSFAPHVLLRETGQAFTLEFVALPEHRLADGGDFHAINPRGMVPVLDLGDQGLLTEQSVIAQYICDKAERRDLLPAPNTLERARVLEWQSYVATEIHKPYALLFRPIDPAMATMIKDQLVERFSRISDHLLDRPYLTGEAFTLADMLLFVVSFWGDHFALNLRALPGLRAFQERIAGRPAVRAALAAEGPGMIAL